MSEATRREPWLPAGFAHPTHAEVMPDVHLRPIRGQNVGIDYPAVMGSRGRLWAKYGDEWGWPPAGMTAEEDRADLEHHEREILGRGHGKLHQLARSKTAS